LCHDCSNCFIFISTPLKTEVGLKKKSIITSQGIPVTGVIIIINIITWLLQLFHFHLYAFQNRGSFDDKKKSIISQGIQVTGVILLCY
jgi:hypothetical protein